MQTSSVGGRELNRRGSALLYLHAKPVFFWNQELTHGQRLTRQLSHTPNNGQKTPVLVQQMQVFDGKPNGVPGEPET
jgi:hypothetical protein